MRNLFFVLSILLLNNIPLAAQQSGIWSLRDCIKYAVENSITIKKYTLDNETAELNYKQTGYNKLPSVTGSATGSTSFGARIDPITSSFVNQQIFSNNIGINAQMVLFQGNSLNLQIEKNELLVKRSELYIQEAQNSITLSVLEAYLQALYYYEGIKVAENALSSSGEELNQAQIKFNSGAIARLELADLETQHANNKSTLINSKNLYDQQVLSLKQLLELEPGAEFAIENIPLEHVQIVIPDKQEVFVKASELLPDLKIYDLSRGSYEKDIKIAKSGYMPTLSLSAGINSGFTSTMDYAYSEQLKTNRYEQVGLSLSIPIFSKFQSRTNVKLAMVQLEQNELDKRSASKTLYSKIENIYQNAIANAAQQNASELAKNNAKLAYELARKKYEFGGLTATELAVSRNTYLNAEQTYLQSKYLTSLYQQLLRFYQGESLIE